MNKIGKAIAVFAYNIESKILDCLESIKHGIEEETDKCYVLVNGSTDNTAKLVSDFIKNNSFCELVEIPLGDKANAWNVFIHELSPVADIYFCVDGDCEFFPDSFEQLHDCLRNDGYANIAAAIPACSGRNSNIIARDMLKNGGVAGNLYAMSCGFVERIRQNKVFMPIGWIGDDSLIGALAYWDLNPKQEWDTMKVHVCQNAKYRYKPLSLLNPKDYKLYFRRRVRYSLRDMQSKALRAIFKDKGLEGIPKTVDDLYSNELTHLHWRGIDTIFDFFAIALIRRSIKMKINPTEPVS